MLRCSRSWQSFAISARQFVDEYVLLVLVGPMSLANLFDMRLFFVSQGRSLDAHFPKFRCFSLNLSVFSIEFGVGVSLSVSFS